ncbi:LysR family transcriptional regulator [Sulfurospirillum arcachonense]|uniref:LysR family transcriptional regulator n=1 Tax=Sulfurospirillum arcachonense TaxID=57666 RepID=UPI000468E6C7|nr:LysR family transcriptional regulator [Sulfurospirillum arcachonense]
MTLKEIELFYMLSENPHVSQLSKKILLSQSAISLAIKSLEAKLGEPLFDRIGKKLILNERGRDFKEKTYQSFLSLKDAQNFFKEEKISGALHVAASKTIGNFIMPQILYDFLLKYENIDINKEVKNSSQIIEMVKNGKLDIGFIESECNEEDIIKEVMGEDELVVVTSDQALPSKMYLDELYNKKWILREKGSGTREVFLNEIGALAKDLKIFMEYLDFAEIKELLKRNIEVVTCISKVAIKKELKDRDLKQIKLINIDVKRNFYCIYHKNKYKSKLFETFKQFAKKGFN